MSQDMQMKQIEINITLDDLVAFNGYIVKRSPQLKRGYLAALFSVPIVVLLIGVLLFKSFPIIIAEMIIAILWLIFFPRLYWHLLDNNVKRMLGERQTKGVLGNHVISIDESGLRETTEVNDSKVAWTGFDSVEKDDQHIFAFINATMAHIIPTRAFSDSKQANEFYDLMKQYIEKSKQLS